MGVCEEKKNKLEIRNVVTCDVKNRGKVDVKQINSVLFRIVLNQTHRDKCRSVKTFGDIYEICGLH